MTARDAGQRLSKAGDQLGQWLDEAGRAIEAGGEVPAETWGKIRDAALEIARLAGTLATGDDNPN